MLIDIPRITYSQIIGANQIVKVLTRTEQAESEFIKIKQVKEHALTFRHKGHDVLVLNSKNQSLIKRYEHVLLTDPDTCFTSMDPDISDFNWIKHPLLKSSYLAKHTIDLVLDSWTDTFSYKADREGDPGLRNPQIGALHALQAHWSVSNEPAIVVLPTGTGKTETMLSTMICNSIKHLLVVVPTDALRDQLSGKFSTLGILPEFKIVGEECENPIVGIMKHSFKLETEVDAFFDKVNVVVATMSVLAACTPEIQYYLGQKVSNLFIDEAHHTPAKTWRRFRAQLEHCRIVLFTATPFRNDGKRLEGKIIFNFPLALAQEQGYFKPIRFKPVSEFDRRLADEAIAELAVATLREDLNDGFDHILMVRVNKIPRAEEIKVFYDRYPEFSPVLVHSQIKPEKELKNLLQAIIDKEHRIIICVDMLGEGFDLPELKIAAFHDTKKSLAITLQLAGRFTRVKSTLGPATFIANIAEPEVTEDLENLYFKDSDWNVLLPDLSVKMSLEQEDFRTFLEGFKGFPEKFPIQAIRHPLSTVIFKTKTKSWRPLHYRAGILKSENYEYVYSDYNDEKEVLLLILGQRAYVKWAKVEDFTSMNFDIIVCHFDKKTKLLYIHASNTNSYYERLGGVLAPESYLLKGQEIFRAFDGINRLRLHNLGVREPMGRATSYIMRVGSDIRRTLKHSDLAKAIKSNIFGAGFENGSRNNLGCSANGRIWSMRANNIPTWIRWCKVIGAKITDESIDPASVLKGTLIPVERSTVPDSKAFAIEWPDFIYRELIGVAEIRYANNECYGLWDCELSLVDQFTSEIHFKLETPGGDHLIKLLLLLLDDGRTDYRIDMDKGVYIDNANTATLAEFLYKYPPLIYFTDGSFLEGNLYTEIEHINSVFDRQQIFGLDWGNTNLREESQTYLKKPTSIQYYMLEKLKAEGKYQVIMDDDDKGEVADIVAFDVDQRNNLLNIDLFHCKYANGGTVGSRIDNFYAVCAQAQKSIKWMENTDLLFRQLQRRSDKRLRVKGVSRFEIGDADLLDIYRRKAKKDLKVHLRIFIVQPGLSVSRYKEEGDISSLLASVESYLKETWDAPLLVYGNQL
jgi:superfamily II DNA or RNA helicase